MDRGSDPSSLDRARRHRAPDRAGGPGALPYTQACRGGLERRRSGHGLDAGHARGIDEGARVFREHIEECASLTDRPFAVNVPVGVDGQGRVLPFTDSYIRTVLAAREKDAFLAQRLTVLTTSAGFPGAYVDLVKDAGMVHQHKAGSTRQAVKAVHAGVDVVLAAGFEMGGHAPAAAVHSFVLLPSVTEAIDVPVLLTGGVRDGRGLAAAMAMGADGVAMGTRFILTRDNVDWHPAYLQALLDAGEGDDVAFDGVYGPCRGLRNAASDQLLAYRWAKQGTSGHCHRARALRSPQAGPLREADPEVSTQPPGTPRAEWWAEEAD